MPEEIFAMGLAVIGFLRRLCPVLVLLPILVSPTSAETIAETARQWGLVGLWSLDCSLPPDYSRGTVLSCEIAGDRLLHHRAGVSWTSPPLAHGPRAKTWLAPQ